MGKPTDTDSGSQAVERAVRIGELIDLYGPLLTDRQRQFITLHYVEDLSFGEIAQEYGISRQAVHDAVKHAEQGLKEYDRKLALKPEQLKQRDREAGVRDVEEAVSSGVPPAKVLETSGGVEGLEPAIKALEEMCERIRRSGGIIYNGEQLRQELEKISEELKQLSSSTTERQSPTS